MVAKTIDLMGEDNVGIGTDLCQDQPDSVVEWMRVGRWTKSIDYGEGMPIDRPGFPEYANWFEVISIFKYKYRFKKYWYGRINGFKSNGCKLV